MRMIATKWFTQLDLKLLQFKATKQANTNNKKRKKKKRKKSNKHFPIKNSLHSFTYIMMCAAV